MREGSTIDVHSRIFYNISYRVLLYLSGQIPVVQLNFSQLSYDSAFDRDAVEACVKEVLGALQRSIAAKRNVEFTFTAIGRLQIRDSRVKMKFFKEFINNMDGSGKLVEALQDVRQQCVTYSNIIVLCFDFFLASMHACAPFISSSFVR